MAERVMNIAIINTYANNGGAANAANRLHISLRRSQKVNSNYIVRYKGNSRDNKTRVAGTIRKERVINKIDAFLQRAYVNKNRTGISTTMFSTPFSGVDITRNPFVQRADIINMHWVAKYISLSGLQRLVDMNKPLVWTLHDERAYTGGCHYTAGCSGYLHNCSHCDQLSFDPLRLPAYELRKKIKILEKADLTVVATSRWHYERIKNSSLFSNNRIELIPNSLDIEHYSPVSRQGAKESLGLSSDIITLQFGAHNVKDIRKGYRYLLDAIQICLQDEKFASLCKQGKIVVLRLGKVSDKDDDLPIPALKLGLVRNNNRMVQIYNATDIYVLPSLEDNLPYAMIESMSCGTPVVGFDTGGIPDAVDGQCGVLVPPQDSASLARAILDLVFDKEKRMQMGINSRKKVEANYSYEIQARNYLSLYESILEARN